MTNSARRRLLIRTAAIVTLLALVAWALRSLSPTPSPSNISPDTTASTKDAPRSKKSGLRLPVAGVDTGQLRDTYAAPRSGGRTHDAIDIMAPEGTPVFAAIDGFIARRYTSANGGHSLYEIGPDSAWVYFYAHLVRYAGDIAGGDSVRRGQIIGYVGDTGNAPDGVYHLHFAVWALTDSAGFWHGPSVDPYPLLMKGRRPKR